MKNKIRLCPTLYLPRDSIEQGRTAVCPATTVTFTMGTSKAGSIPETANDNGGDRFTQHENAFIIEFLY